MPSYLAYYYRIAPGGLQIKDLTFGDRLDVQSQVFDAGRRAVLTVHRLRRITGPGESHRVEPFDLAEIYTKPRPDCMYVENLNVWVSRGDGQSNVALVRAPPIGFTHAHLPKLPDTYSPRNLYVKARSLRTFPGPTRDNWPRSCPDLVIGHAGDLTRDVNSAGLLYFASFFPSPNVPNSTRGAPEVDPVAPFLPAPFTMPGSAI